MNLYILFYGLRLSGTSAEDGHTLSHRKRKRGKLGYLREGTKYIIYINNIILFIFKFIIH